MRGGKRKGSGRKARSVPLKAVTVRLEPGDVARLKQLCKEKNISQAKLISAWIKHEKSRPREKPKNLGRLQTTKRYALQTL